MSKKKRKRPYGGTSPKPVRQNTAQKVVLLEFARRRYNTIPGLCKALTKSGYAGTYGNLACILTALRKKAYIVVPVKYVDSDTGDGWSEYTMDPDIYDLAVWVLSRWKYLVTTHNHLSYAFEFGKIKEKNASSQFLQEFANAYDAVKKQVAKITALDVLEQRG